MDTKDRVMEIHQTSFKKGFFDISLNEIMKASDITTGGLYYHFDSKDILFIAVIEKYIFKCFDQGTNRTL